MHYAERCQTGKFRIALWLSLAILAAGLLLLLRIFFSIDEEDRAVYRQLVDKTQDSPSSTTLAQQKRSGIAKEIYFMQGTARLTLKLKAANSTLQLNQNGANTEIIEILNNVVGVMQEELFYRLPDGRDAFLQSDGRLLLRNGNPSKRQDFVGIPLESTKAMQTVRYFESKMATYFYKDNRLLADQVKVSRFTFPGHTFPEAVEGVQPTMVGMAKSAELNFVAGVPLFKANQLKAAFYQVELP